MRPEPCFLPASGKGEDGKMKKEKDRSHLGIEDRVEIAAGLAERRTATEIASRIGCAKTTVSREVKGHCSVERKGAYGRSFNDCARRTDCKVEIMQCFFILP